MLAPATRLVASRAPHRAIARLTTLRTTTVPTLQRSTRPVTQIRMASDDAYAAFLEKANQDPMQGRTHAAAARPNRELKSVDEGEEVPRVLGDATKDKFYVSDADEGFVPVALRWGGSDLPDEGAFSLSLPPLFPFSLSLFPTFSSPPFFRYTGTMLTNRIEEFAKLVEHWDPASAEVDISDTSDWNRSGEYGDLVEAVTKAVKGADVRVYRIGKDATRAEYFVVGCEAGRLLGVKAAAVES